MTELQRARIAQAREALETARELIASGMDNELVLTNIYYAFYYPVIAVLHEGKVPEVMQTVTFGLFEQRFIENGAFSREHAAALSRALNIKPDCSGEKRMVSRSETEAFIGQADAFIAAAERFIGR